MTSENKRLMLVTLAAPVITGAVGTIILIGGLWIFSSMLAGSLFSVSPGVYKNYVERKFVDEAVIENRSSPLFRGLGQQTEDRQNEKNGLEKGKLTTGDFVIIPINGIISGDPGSYQYLFDQLLIAAQKNPNTKAVIFYINSPGGEVTVCDNLYNEVKKLKANGIKTVAFVNSMSASGAYYITANSDKIVAAPTALVGSIGVIVQLYNFEGLAGKIGIRVETIKSGEMKDIGSPFKRMSEEERNVLQRIVDSAYERFISIVREGRDLTNYQVAAVATGAILTAEDAMVFGLVDEVGYMKRAVDAAKELTGVTNPRLVIYQREMDFFDVFMENASFLNFNSVKPEKVVQEVLPSPTFLYQWIP